MKRAALTIAVLLAVAAAAIATTRPTAPAPPQAAVPPRATQQQTPPARLPAPATRQQVNAQRDLAPGADRERRRINRTRLLESTMITPARAHGVSILVGEARPTPNAPQQMVVTPDPGLTVREIAAGVRWICRGLKDPCRTSDYRFLIHTPTGRVSLPAHLIDPERN